jgi:2-polyprenyl-3-methyl-5-hydroxy-6-metoxy-1,4-benzoquinol methylase
MFTRAFDHWDHKTFRQYIYNEEYIQVDPAYSTIRPQKDVGMVHQLIAGARHVRILDYGGGTGVCAQILAGQGYQADSWDPITDMDSDGLYNSRSIPAAASYDLVTAFEVFEHSPHPAETIREATSFLRQDGVLFFSTCAIDALPPRTVGFWYIAPRNGHVTIYTTASLRHILSTNGYRMHSFHTNWHIAFRTVPHWLRHLFPGT